MKLAAIRKFLHRDGRDKPAEKADPPRPALLTPFLSYTSRLGMEDLRLLGFADEQIAARELPGAQAMTDVVWVRLPDDGSREFYDHQLQEVAAAARHAVRAALASIGDDAPRGRLEQIESTVIDLAVALTMHSEFEHSEFAGVWAPFEAVLPGLADFRPDRAFRLTSAMDYVEVLTSGVVEVLIIEGQQAVSRRGWSGLCPQCDTAVSLEWEQARTTKVAFCKACPTVFTALDAAGDRFTSVRLFQVGSLAEAAIAADPDFAFGPESDWIKALMRVVGEFSARTWSRISDEYDWRWARPTMPPHSVMVLGLGGRFRRRHLLAKRAIEDAILRDVSSLGPHERDRLSSILSRIAHEILGRTYQREPADQAIGQLQKAMDTVAGRPTRSVIKMLELEAGFLATMREHGGKIGTRK